MGLRETGGKLIYCKSTQTPRTCILLRINLTALPIHKLCSRDFTAVKVQLHKGSTKREIILASGYFPYDDSTPPTKRGGSTAAPVQYQVWITANHGM
jgi:hypothetical protein